MTEIEVDLPQNISELLLSILLPSSLMSEHMHNFIKQLPSFFHQKDHKKKKGNKQVKLAYDSTFARNLPAECFIINTLEFHLQNILATENVHLCYTIQFTMKNVINIMYIYLQQHNKIDTNLYKLLIPILTDVRMEPFIADLTNICKIMIEDDDKLESLIEKHFLSRTYAIFKELCSDKTEVVQSTKNNILIAILDFWCNIANEIRGKTVLNQLFFGKSESIEFTDVLFSFLNSKMSHKVIIQIVQLFVELLNTQDDALPVNEMVATVVLKYLNKNTTVLKIWASCLVFGKNIWFYNNLHEDDDDLQDLATLKNDINEFQKAVKTLKSFFNLLTKSRQYGTLFNCNIFSGTYILFKFP